MEIFSEQKIRYANSPFGVFAVDQKLELLWANQAAVAVHPLIMMPDGLAELLKNPVSSVLECLEQEQEAASFEASSRFPDISLYFVPEYGGGCFSGALVHCCYDKALRHSQLQYSSLLQMQDFIIENIATSINAISDAREKDQATVSQTLERLFYQNLSLLRFARSFSVYSEYAYGKSGSVFANIEIGELLGGLAEKFHQAFEDILLFSYTPPVASLLTVGDRKKLGRAITSLVREAAGHAAKLELKAELAGKYAAVIIQNDAPEISARARNALEGGNFSISEGDHLGLATVRMILDEHGADLTLSRDDSGCRYTVLLPLGVNASMISLENFSVEYQTAFNDTMVELCDFNSFSD